MDPEGESLSSAAPRWFGMALSLGLTVLLGFSLSAVPLAIVGAFQPLPVGMGTLLLSIAVWLVWRPAGWDVSAGRAATAVPAILILLVAGWVGFNAKYSSQHLLTNRDPGVYVVTGRWLADEGNLLPEARVEPFAEDRSLSFASSGQYDHREDGRLYFQFLHLLPVILAAGAWLGDSWLLLKVPAILGGAALVAFYAFASRLLKPWLALAATVALGVNLVQVHFSRDAYTEILTQVFLFGGLWVLWEARGKVDPGGGLIAGLLLGATAMTRVDAFFYLIPISAYLTYEYLSGRHSLRGTALKRHQSFLLAVLIGLLTTASLGYLDGLLRSPIYLIDLGEQLRLIWLGLLATWALGAVAIVFHRRVAQMWSRLSRAKRPLAVGAAVLIVAGAAFSYFLRPLLEYVTWEHSISLVGSLQERAGVPVDSTRRYAEFSFRWMAWYLGPAALGGAVAGWALLVYRTLLGKASRALPFLMIFSAVTVLYVWRPSITPDHIWAMRRFLPVTIPGLLILGFWFIQWLWDRDRIAWLARAAKLAAVGLLAASLVFPALTVKPALKIRTQGEMLAFFGSVCEELPEDAAVLVITGRHLHAMMPQTIRSFCGVPAAVAPADVPPERIVNLARRWEGRLYVLSALPTAFENQEKFEFQWLILERTLLERPRKDERLRIEFFLAEVPVDT